MLGWMLAGSVLLHLAMVALIWLLHQHGAPADTPEADSDVAVVFQSAGEKQASTATPTPSPQPAPAVGNPAGVPTPAPTTATAAPSAPPAPPPPDTPAPPQPQPQAPQAPQQEASLEAPPQPQPPPAPPPPPAAPPTMQAAPPAPKAPPMVSLDPSEEGEMQMVPRFVMPQPPAPLPQLPPLPRPPPRPRATAHAAPRSRSGFPMPQNWSLATGPESLLSQRGTDVSTRPRGSQSNSEYKHLAGADPGEDWAAELHRWATDHAYYPREAADNGQEGVATIQATINRYGKVLSVDLMEGSGSPFLDMAWLGEWRNAMVPRFPPGTTEDTTTILYTIHYILVRR